jgi:O-antigen/teichoic acid export membrane protein
LATEPDFFREAGKNGAAVFEKHDATELTQLLVGRFRWLRPREQAAKRSALFRLAVISSTVSKAFGLALQAIAIPLVLRSLGQHQYELYLLLTAALATIALTQMGAGPGLTQGIAKASAAGDREKETSLLNAAFRLTGCATMVGGSLMLAAIYLIPPEKLFGAVFAGDRVAILTAANVCVLVVMAQVIFGVVDSALAGYQEQVLTNIGSAIANIISIGLLVVVCNHAPTIIKVILVLYGVPTIFRASNILLLFIRRPYLRLSLTRSCRGAYATLLNVGMAFWVIQITGVLEQHSGTYILAHYSSTAATDFFAVAYKALSLAGAVVGIMTQPLWPAIADAIAHRDIGWIKRSYVKIRRVITIYSTAVAILIISGGPWIFQRVTHISTAGSSMLFILLGFYFVANTWTHLFYTAMMGMNVIWQVVVVLIIENLLMLILGIVFVPYLGVSGMALAYLAASLVLPVWLLPRLMSKAMGRIGTVEAAGVTVN